MNHDGTHVELNDKLELCSPEMRAIYTAINREIARKQRKEDAE